MPFIPQQAQPNLDTDGLRRFNEDQYREIARAWTETDKTIDGLVSYSAQSKTSAQQTQGRRNVYAAPFDAMGYYGIQFNGSGEVDQSLLGNVTANNSFPYFTDGWIVFCGGAVQALASPYNQDLPPGFQKHVRIFTTVGVATLAAGDHGSMIHYIEGYRIARLAWGTANAQPLTLGFWIRTPFAGNAAVTIGNGNASRGYTVDVACSGVLEWKTITIPGCLDGVWPVGNTLGMQIIFNFGSGSTYRGTANVWNSAAFTLATAATTNFHTAGGNMSSIVGLMVLPGSEAPNAERSVFVQRPWDQELIQCRRYWQKSYAYGIAPGATLQPHGCAFMYISAGLTASTNASGGNVRFGISMCATPTMTAYSIKNGTVGKWSDDVAGLDCGVTIDHINESGFRFYAVAATVQTGVNITGHWVANARL